jgi:quercetin dioxygenase-like cupin family protein
MRRPVKPRCRRTSAAVATLATVVILAGCSASSGPVTVEELGAGERTDPVDVEVEGPLAVTYRRITIEPGAGTGEHCHHGQLIAVVEAGELTHRAPVYPGGVHIYRTGESIVEGASYVHEGVNEGDEDVVLLVTYITEAGEPLAETDLSRCDG